MHDWARAGALAELRRGLDVFGLGSLAERRTAPPEVVALADARVAARSEREFAEADRLRAEIGDARLGRAGRGRRLRARAPRVTRDLVYGRNAVREAFRGRRAVLEVWASERAVATLGWLEDGPRPRTQARARADRGRWVSRSSGRRRVVRAVPVRGRVGARRRRAAPPLLPRPGDRPAESRRRDPERGRRRRNRRRAAGSRGRRDHPGRLASIGRSGGAHARRRGAQPCPLSRRREGRPAVGVRRRRRRGNEVWDLDLRDGLAFVFGAEGGGVRPLVRRTCDGTVSIPSRPASNPST